MKHTELVLLKGRGVAVASVWRMEVQDQAASLIWLWWGSTWLGHILVDGSVLEAWVKGREHTLAGSQRASCAGQAQALPLSYTCRPLIFIPTPSWGLRESAWLLRATSQNLLTFTHYSKVRPLPLEPPLHDQFAAIMHQTGGRIASKGVLPRIAVIALTEAILETKLSTQKSLGDEPHPNQSKPQLITWKKNYFPGSSLIVRRKDDIYHRIWSVFYIVSVSFLLYG